MVLEEPENDGPDRCGVPWEDGLLWRWQVALLLSQPGQADEDSRQQVHVDLEERKMVSKPGHPMLEMFSPKTVPYLFIDVVFGAKNEITSTKGGDHGMYLTHALLPQRSQQIVDRFVDDDEMRQIFGVCKSGQDDGLDFIDQPMLTESNMDSLRLIKTGLKTFCSGYSRSIPEQKGHYQGMGKADLATVS